MSLLEIKHFFHGIIKVTVRKSRKLMEKRISHYAFQHWPSGPIQGFLNIMKCTDPGNHIPDNNQSDVINSTDPGNHIPDNIQSLQPLKANDGIEEPIPASPESTRPLAGPMDLVQKTTASTTDNFDYSVVIDNNRKSIMERLDFFHVDFERNEKKRKLFVMLKNYLEDRHPLKRQIETISEETCHAIIRLIENNPTKSIRADRVPRKIVNYCFKYSATSPLAGLYDLVERATVRSIVVPMEVESDPFPGIPLVNPDNICYLNALVNGVKANKSSREFIGKDTTVVATHLMALFDQNPSSTAADLRGCLPQPLFAAGKQSDPHEAWMFLVDKLPILRANSLVTLKTTLTCADCQRTVVSLEKVPSPSRLCHSTTEEILSYETTTGMVNPQLCPHCYKIEHMTEEIIISEASQILCFNAMRYDSQAIVVSKNIELGGRRYKVRAVVTHIGENRHRGHYITDIFHKNQWWTVNDDKIYKATVEPSGGYLFFYEAVDEPMETGQQQEEMPTTTRPRAKKTNKKVAQRAVDAIIQQKHNVEAMKAIRREGIQNLNNKKSNSSDVRTDNPAIIGGLTMNLDIKDNYVMSGTCIVCNTAWFKKDIGARTKKCTKCASERNLEIPTYGEKNDMVPGKPQQCLLDLTFIEECCIQKASPLLHLYCRKGGLTGSKGNVIAFEQDLSVLVTILPRLPKDLPFIVLQTQGQSPVQLKVRPDKIREALQSLIANSPAYHDVVLSEENLQYYEQNEGQVHGLQELRYDWEQSKKSKEREQLPVLIPEKDDITEEMLSGDMPVPDSMVPKVTQTAGVLDLLLKATKETDDNGQSQQSTHVVGEGGDVEMTDTSDEEQPMQTDENLSKNARKKRKKKEKKIRRKALHEGEKQYAWPTRGTTALSEYTTVGYYSMCYPTLFPNGKGDITLGVRPGKTPEFRDWILHLMEQADRRFIEHPTFAMVVANQLQRRTALSVGNVVARDAKLQDLSMEEFRAKLSVDVDAVLGMLRYYSKNLIGSPQYFHHQMIMACAFLDHIRLRSEDKEMFNLFITLSPADFHWDDLHQLFKQSKDYLGKTVIVQ
jgi:hypothetical protein